MAILLAGRVFGSTDISVEPIWPDRDVICQVLFSVVIGKLDARGHGGLPFLLA